MLKPAFSVLFIFSIFGDAVFPETDIDLTIFLHLHQSNPSTEDLSGFYEPLTGTEKFASGRSHQYFM